MLQSSMAALNPAMGKGLLLPLLPAAAAACRQSGLEPSRDFPSLTAGLPWTRSLHCAVAWARSAFRRRSCGGCWRRSRTLWPTMVLSPRAACTLHRRASWQSCGASERLVVLDGGMPLYIWWMNRPVINASDEASEHSLNWHACWLCSAGRPEGSEREQADQVRRHLQVLVSLGGLAAVLCCAALPGDGANCHSTRRRQVPPPHVAAMLLPAHVCKFGHATVCCPPCRVADWFAQLNNKMGGDLKKIQVCVGGGGGAC